MATVSFIIDPPSPMAPLAEWKRHAAELLELKKQEPDNKNIDHALRYASTMVSVRSTPPVKDYSPSQPRDPAGTSTGGQWASQGDVHPSVDEVLDDEELLELKKAVAGGTMEQILAAMEPVYEDAESDGTVPTLVLNPDGSIPDGFFDSRQYNLPDGTVVGIDGALDYLMALGDKFAGPGGPKHNREAIVLIGPSAAGKSTLAEQLAAHGYAIVDADEAKKIIPGYNNGRGSAEVHEESSAISKIVQAQYAKRGTNVIIQTVSSGLPATTKRVDNLRKAGYRVEMVGMAIDGDEAARRMGRRYLQTGRFVPAALVRSSPKVSIDIYEIAKGYTDGYAKVDATPSGSPIVKESTINWLAVGKPVFGAR